MWNVNGNLQSDIYKIAPNYNVDSARITPPMIPVITREKGAEVHVIPLCMHAIPPGKCQTSSYKLVVHANASSQGMEVYILRADP